MELTTYSEEVFSISRLFSSNTFPLEKVQNASLSSFDSNTPPAFSVLGRHSRLAPAPESRRKRSVTKTLCHDGGEVWMKVLRKGVFKSFKAFLQGIHHDLWNEITSKDKRPLQNVSNDFHLR